MNLDKFIILELIPTNFISYGGSIIQLQALKIDDMKLLSRFDYRLNDDKLPIPEMKEFINYDNDKFTYVDSESDILEAFKDFVDDYPLLFIYDKYTYDFLEYLDNEKHDILEYFNLNYNKDIINEIINKYNIEPTNHIVDILYEALMMK